MSESDVVYHGVISEEGPTVVTKHGDLDPRHDLANHSPDGFEWGYAGSGPAQLALAMVAHATGDADLALRTYQRFKDEVVSRFERGKPWSMTALAVQEAAKRLDRARHFSWGAGDVQVLKTGD